MRRRHTPRQVRALSVIGAIAVVIVIPASASAFHGPRPFPLPLPYLATSVVAGTDGSAVFFAKEANREPWMRSTARPGDRTARREVLLGDGADDRRTVGFRASGQTSLFVSEFQPRTGESVVQVIPVPDRSSAGQPVTISTSGAFALGSGDPAIGPDGAAAVLFAEGVGPGNLTSVMALRPSGSDGWLPPVPVPATAPTARYVLFSGAGDAVLLSYPTERGQPAPSVQRISHTGAFGPPIDLGFEELGLPVTNQVDFTAAFSSDGALHAAISLYRDYDRPKDPSRLVLSRLAAGSDHAVPTVLGPSADPEADVPSLSLAPGPGGSMALVASRTKDGTLRVFESTGAAQPRLSTTIRGSSGVSQGAKLLRAPDGGLNLVWFSNALQGQGPYGLVGSHRRAGATRFSKPGAISKSALTRGRTFLDDATQLPDGNVALAFVRDGGDEGRAFGLIARP